MTIQPTLFAVGAPALDRIFSRIRRVDFGHGAWVDYHPAWCSGADQLFREIEAGTEWHAHRRPMYERVVDVPRLTGSVSYTHLRAHETPEHLVCRLLLE